MVEFDTLDEDRVEVAIEEGKIVSIKNPYSGIRIEHMYREAGIMPAGQTVNIDTGPGTPFAEMDIFVQGYRAHLYHLKVPHSMRGKRVGSVLIEIFKQFIREADVERVSGRVGNGGTKEFLIKNGLNRKWLHKVDPKPISGESVAIGTEDDRFLAMETSASEFSREAEGVLIEEAIEEW